MKKIETQTAAQIISCLLVAYSTAIVINFTLSLLFTVSPDTDTVFWFRMTGPYKYAYWIMLAASISPLLLLLKKLRTNIYLILFLTIYMNIGWLMESIIIRIPGLFRGDLFPFERQSIILLRGAVVALLIILIGHLIDKRKSKEHALT